MITINEIAKMANVSRTTVSRVLNNSGYVSDKTRKRVLKVIEETEYVPNEHAKSMRTKKTKVIGVITPTIKTETSGKIVTGIDNELSKYGYQILLANTSLDKDREIEYLNLLKARQVDGIILIATNVSSSLVKRIDTLQVPVVVIGQEIESVSNVLYNDYQASREAVQHLIKQGHQRISFIGVDEEDRTVGYLRKKGYLDEMKSNNLNIEEGWVQKGIFNIKSGYKAMENTFKHSNNRPTAVFAVTDRLAIGAIDYLKAHDFKLPSDMSIISIGAADISEYVEPKLTTIDFQSEKAGQESAKQLLKRINSPAHQPERLILGFQLRIRDSVVSVK